MAIGTISELCGKRANSALPIYEIISYKKIGDKKKDRTNLSKQTLILTILYIYIYIYSE
jgi:hypothetical protein